MKWLLGLTCYTCKGILHPRFCDSVERCSSNQQCSLTQFTKESGDVKYDLGCLTTSGCRDRAVKSINHEKCFKCCSTDLCNNAGCGETKVNTSGTVCYSCKGQLQSEECHTVGFCPHGELCYLEESEKYGETFYNSGCQTQHACEFQYGSSIIFGRRRQIEHPAKCRKCCDNDLCNIDCNRDNTPTTALPTTTTVTTTTQSIAAGRQFYMMFLKNHRANKLRIYVITDTPGKCIMYDPYLQSNYTSHVSANATFQLNNANTMRTIEVGRQLAYLECDMDVAVYGMNYNDRSSDGYLALPKSSLGRQYVIPTFKTGPPQFGIGAVYDNTNVTLRFTMAGLGGFYYKGHRYQSGDQLSITLSRYQTFYVSGSSDLSGTLLTSSNPVVVVSGSEASVMNNECCNYMTEMILPYEQQGTKYIVPSQYKATCIYRVLSYVQNNVTINGRAETILPGNFIDRESSSVGTVIATKGVLVQLYCDSINVNHSSYDSKMVTVPSFDNFKDDYVFEIVSDFPDDQPPDYFYIDIIVPRDEWGGILLDGHHISSGLKSMFIFDETPWLVHTYKTRKGKHRMSHLSSVPFGLLVMGRTQYEGYSYPAGFQLKYLS